MAETLNVDQRVKLAIGELTVQGICMVKEIEDLRTQMVAKDAELASLKPAPEAPASS